jgi:hypothetical protein
MDTVRDASAVDAAAMGASLCLQLSIDMVYRGLWGSERKFDGKSSGGGLTFFDGRRSLCPCKIDLILAGLAKGVSRRTAEKTIS